MTTREWNKTTASILCISVTGLLLSAIEIYKLRKRLREEQATRVHLETKRNADRAGRTKVPDRFLRNSLRSWITAECF